MKADQMSDFSRALIRAKGMLYESFLESYSLRSGLAISTLKRYSARFSKENRRTLYIRKGIIIFRRKVKVKPWTLKDAPDSVFKGELTWVGAGPV